MSKKFLLTLGLVAATAMTVSCAFADSTIYTDPIGRMHFMGKEGGYSNVRPMQMNQLQSSVVNDAVNQFSNPPKKEVVNTVDKKITDVIKETETKTVPASSHKSTFTSPQRKMDPSSPYGYGAVDLPSSGVNESKTIYTDDLGRLHFFGKANLIKE